MSTSVTSIESGHSAALIEVPYSEKAGVVAGDEVIFKDAEGREEYGVVKYVNRPTIDKDKVAFTGKVLRRATPNDIQKVEGQIDAARQALNKCRELVAKYGVDMHVFRSGLSFDGNRAYFMFTSDDRVDFRDLVKDLAKTIQKQIHLRQIGPRDKARHVGGYGKCGRALCCNTWLGKFESITMEMVREQALEAKGSSKLSGVCGKLLCCLRYEVDAYRELRSGLPRIGTKVTLKKPKQLGIVIALDILNQKLKLLFEDGSSQSVGVEEITTK